MELEKLLQEHRGIVYKICRLYRDTKEDQEDLFQEISYQLWRSLPTFKGEAKITSWIYRIALNTALASYRVKRLKISFPGEMPEIMDEQENDEQERRRQLFLFALKKLNDAEKALIILYLEDQTYQEIAEVIGISENNVGVRLNRIKAKLKNLLNQ
jgi:RNA polymerase sigma-70 factor (ECF subfamily)